LIQVLTALASTKIDLNKTYSIEKRKQGVLHYACAHSTKDIIELLLLNGGNLNLDDQDCCKPLDYSMSGNNVIFFFQTLPNPFPIDRSHGISFR